MGRVCHGPSLLWAEMSRNPADNDVGKYNNEIKMMMMMMIY